MHFELIMLHDIVVRATGASDVASDAADGGGGGGGGGGISGSVCSALCLLGAKACCAYFVVGCDNEFSAAVHGLLVSNGPPATSVVVAQCQSALLPAFADATADALRKDLGEQLRLAKRAASTAIVKASELLRM